MSDIGKLVVFRPRHEWHQAYWATPIQSGDTVRIVGESRYGFTPIRSLDEETYREVPHTSLKEE